MGSPFQLRGRAEAAGVKGTLRCTGRVSPAWDERAGGTPDALSKAQQRLFCSAPVPPEEQEVFKRFLYSFAFLVCLILVWISDTRPYSISSWVSVFCSHGHHQWLGTSSLICKNIVLM